LGTPPQPQQPATPSAGGWNVRVKERVPAYATYLTLTRNPMVPVIYFGCAVMLAGLMIAFFIRSRQVWFRIDPAKRRLYVAALYRHQAATSLDRATRAALDELAAPEEQTPATAIKG
jgi:cytochrome c biogenesis protein